MCDRPAQVDQNIYGVLIAYTTLYNKIHVKILTLEMHLASTESGRCRRMVKPPGHLDPLLVLGVQCRLGLEVGFTWANGLLCKRYLEPSSDTSINQTVNIRRKVLLYTSFSLNYIHVTACLNVHFDLYICRAPCNWQYSCQQLN